MIKSNKVDVDHIMSKKIRLKCVKEEKGIAKLPSLMGDYRIADISIVFWLTLATSFMALPDHFSFFFFLDTYILKHRIDLDLVVSQLRTILKYY